MLASFRSFVLAHELLPSRGSTLLAVSGGVDSVIMAHLFHQANFPFAIAHCNFNLRDVSSDHDELWVRELAKQYQVDIYTASFDTLAHARQKGVSIQMAARSLRYAWFQKVCQVHEFERVATAHHSNDSLETALLNLIKGTGIAGLQGIAPIRGRYIRPLLFASKAEIVAYAKTEQLAWREDNSNAKDDYQRNLLRNQVVPLLKKINPNLEHTFELTSERLCQTALLLHKQVAVLRQQLCRQQGDHHYIAVETMRGNPSATVLLWELVKPFGFHFSAIQAIWTQEPNTGAHIQSGSHRLHVDRDQWIIIPHTASTTSLHYHLAHNTTKCLLTLGVLHCTQVARPQHQLVTDNRLVAAFDWAKLHFPLTIRPWHAGDTFYPLGMEKRKKISDFLIDNKVPRPFKDQVWVVTSQKEIVWVIGHRIDNRFRLTERTEEVYELHFSPYIASS